MSRVHDALRKAEQMLEAPSDVSAEIREAEGNGDGSSLVVAGEHDLSAPDQLEFAPMEHRASNGAGIIRRETRELQVDWRSFLSRCATIPFKPAPEAHLMGADGGQHGGPSEEFRSLRTRLNRDGGAAGKE